MSNQFEISGKIILIEDTMQVTDKFSKREFVVEVEDGRYSQKIKFQMVQDNCDELDKFQVGQNVVVDFNIVGRGYEKNGQTNYFTNLQAWRLAKTGIVRQGEPVAKNISAPVADNSDDLPF